MHWQPAHGRNSSLWLALRAGVLRRAVSQTARPVLRPQAKAKFALAAQRYGHAPPVTVQASLSRQQECRVSLKHTMFHAVWPNHSLNRTYCGGPAFGQ